MRRHEEIGKNLFSNFRRNYCAHIHQSFINIIVSTRLHKIRKLHISYLRSHYNWKEAWLTYFLWQINTDKFGGKNTPTKRLVCIKTCKIIDTPQMTVLSFIIMMWDDKQQKKQEPAWANQLFIVLIKELFSQYNQAEPGSRQNVWQA